MSVQAPRHLLVVGQWLASLSTGGDEGVGRKAPVPRFPTADVPGVTAASGGPRYLRGRPGSTAMPVSVIASALRRLRGSEVAFECVPASPVASAWRPQRRIACELQSSPRAALAPAVEAWRRAAAAKRSARIAGRLSRLLAGKRRQVLQ
jgi:hypothetical protein